MILENVLEILAGTLAISTSTGRYTSRVYVSGPTGSGKSRLGWESYCKLANEKRKYGLDKVAFVSVDLSNQPIETVDDLVRHIVHTCAEGVGGIALAKVKTHKLSLTDLLPHLTGWTEGAGRAALVLHIDEFHRKPEMTLAIQNEIARLNRTPNSKIIVLPICTGLYDKNFRDFKDIDASSHSRAVYLGYLSKRDGSADHDAAWKITRNATKSVLRRDVLPEALSEAPPVLRYLVEDLNGWPMAAVQLGGQLAAQRALSRAAVPSEVDWDSVSWTACENGLDKIINFQYRSPTTTLQGILTPTGLFKLVTLVLSPFPVCRGGCNIISREEVFRCSIVIFPYPLLLQGAAERADEWGHGCRPPTLRICASPTLYGYG
jgi:hypothetical protein